MCEHFGTEGAQEALLKTRMIFISHLHQDHYLGIFTLLLQRKKLLRERGTVILKFDFLSF